MAPPPFNVAPPMETHITMLFALILFSVKKLQFEHIFLCAIIIKIVSILFSFEKDAVVHAC